jgi:hypothetical protein
MAVAEASKIVRWYAYAGCLTVVPFVVGGFRLPWYATAFVLGGALAACALLMTLVGPVASRVPLPAVWIGAGLLAAYGTGSLMLHGTVSAGALAAGGYGWALAVVALSYQRRHRAAMRSAAAATSSPRSSTAGVSAATATSSRSYDGATISDSEPRASSRV